MKHLNSRTDVTGIFFAATVLLVVYLLSESWHFYLPVALFWAAIILMVSTLAYQSLRIEFFPSHAKVVLLGIVVTCVVFHLIYQVPYWGIRGSDTYGDMVSAKGILSTGFVMGASQYISQYSYFPMIHIFGAMLSLVSGIDLFFVVKYFPSFLGVAVIPMLYLLIRSIFKEEKIALLSVLLFASLENHILFSSLFVRQTYALVLAVSCLYLYFSAKHSLHPRANLALSIVCLIGAVFAHHLTSFMLAIFLLIHALVTKASDHPLLQRERGRAKAITQEKAIITLTMVALLSVFAYWIYVATSPLYTLASFLIDLFSPGKWGAGTYSEVQGGISAISIQTIRGYVLFYGFFFFTFIFGLIVIYGLLRRMKNGYVETIDRSIETYSFAFFLFFCGITGFVSLYAIPAAAFPDRFLLFGWLFGFAPLVMTILRGKYKWLRRFGVFLLVAFMIFNIYMIDPINYDTRAEGTPLVTSMQDYALASTFDFSSGRILGPQNSLMAIYYMYNNIGNPNWLRANLSTRFDWIVINENELELAKTNPELEAETVATLERLATGGFADYNKIYESNSLIAFKRR